MILSAEQIDNIRTEITEKEGLITLCEQYDCTDSARILRNTVTWLRRQLGE
jgi:hypothetical protein